MSKLDTVELQATDVRFFSQCDEAAFFEWIKKLSFIQKIEGRGRTLYLLVNRAAIDEDALRELLALFHRFEIDLRQLAVFDREEFVEWFRNKNAYWHSEIFK